MCSAVLLEVLPIDYQPTNLFRAKYRIHRCEWVTRLFPNMTKSEMAPLISLFRLSNYAEGQGCFGNEDRRKFYRLLETVPYSQSEVVNSVSFESHIILNFRVICASLAFDELVAKLVIAVSLWLSLQKMMADAKRFVLNPLRHLLSIVYIYAKNPLATVKIEDLLRDTDEAGGPETQQLTNAIGQITQLLRKCWGVAGTGIISENISAHRDVTGASAKIFNPMVDGKKVQAIFGFAKIGDFDFLVSSLDDDVCQIINNVAAVVHSEVFRWGLGNSGQCNKNLGASFLLVWRIGETKMVLADQARAKSLVFGHTRKVAPTSPTTTTGKSRHSKSSRDMSMMGGVVESSYDEVDLAELPGIQEFSERAVLGLLKTFAQLQRDRKLVKWKNDMRLGAGVGDFEVDVNFGLSAGWAMEGAVGSLFKVDATYLSPHVNIAARMCTACAQYGVNILVNHSFHRLLGESVKGKFRHIDNVTFKGSGVVQPIYTYDCRAMPNLCLNGKPSELWDEISRNYSEQLWDTDSDLLDMRLHAVGNDFSKIFDKGFSAYVKGDWKKALHHLEKSRVLMIRNSKEAGWETENMSEDSLGKDEWADGCSAVLISYMKSFSDLKPPDGWSGYRPLTKK